MLSRLLKVLTVCCYDCKFDFFLDDKLDKAKNFPADAAGKHRKKESTGPVKGLSKKKLSDRESRRTARANEKG